MSTTTRLKSTIRDVPDYPRPGIIFKDITPVLSDPQLTRDIVAHMVERYGGMRIDAVAAIEARGFIFGAMLAQALECAFVPVRKAGKLPFHTRKKRYDLEYGTSEIEIHNDAFEEGARVLIHDDLLATGGTACAAGELVQSLGATLVGYSFLINLSFLPGAANIAEQFGLDPDFLVKY